jgi:ubiquinone/menaquinone biosynthesis C-methylase UbiE
MTDKEKPFVWQMNADGPGTYEHYIVPTWMADWAPDMMDAGGVGPGKKVLDAACGTGIMARKAAGFVGPCGRIAALDVNEGMLRVARITATREGAEVIEWYRSDIARMPFFPGEFDVVLCHQALQFLPDKTAALREMKRVLSPGGTLVLGVWGSPEKSPHVPIICDILGKYFGKDSASLFTTACSLSDRRVLENLVRDAGFSKIRIHTRVKIARHPSLAELLPAYFSGFPVAAQIAAMHEEERTRMFRAIATALAPYTENDGLAVPTENIILAAENADGDSPDD